MTGGVTNSSGQNIYEEAIYKRKDSKGNRAKATATVSENSARLGAYQK